MNVIKRSDSVFRTLASGISFAGACWIFLIMFIVVIDVVGRGVFNHPLTGTPEIAQNSVVGIAFLMLPWATATNSHVRSTVVLDKIKGKLYRGFECVAYIISTALLIGIIYSSWGTFIRMLTRMEYTEGGSIRLISFPFMAVLIIGSVFAVWFTVMLILGNLMPDKFGFVYERIAKANEGLGKLVDEDDAPETEVKA